MGFSVMRRGYIAFFLVYLLFYGIVLYWNIEPFISYGDTIQFVADMVNLAAAIFVVRHRPPGRRLPWVFFALSVFLYSMGDLYLLWTTDFMGLELGTPNWSDFFFVVNNIACIFGLIDYLRKTEHIHLVEAAFDLLLSTLAAAGLIYQFLVRPMLAEFEAGATELAIQFFYPVVDIGFLTSCFLLVFGTNVQRFFTRPNLMFIVTFGFMFVIDQFSLFGMVYEIEMAETLLGPLWSVSFFLLVITGTFPEEEVAEARTSPVAERWEKMLLYVRILLPYSFAFMILVLAAFYYNLWDFFFLGSIAMVVLLSLRQIFVLFRNQRLMEKIQENEKKLNQQNMELQKLNRKILRDAEVDYLTQLANRRYIDHTFERLAPETGPGVMVGILLIDVDNFKQINDTYGHQIGDQVLQEVAEAIRSVVREDDIAGRFGGDEFIILLPGARENATRTVAQRLLEKVRGEGSLTDHQVTLSIGCTSCQMTPDHAVHQLMKQADEALYQAKRNGRDQYMVYTPEMAEA